MSVFTKRFTVVVQLHNTQTSKPSSFTTSVRHTTSDRALITGLKRYRGHADIQNDTVHMVVGATVTEEKSVRSRGVGN